MKYLPYKLYYAEMDLKGDIAYFEFTHWKKRLSFITDKVIGRKDVVFLLSINYNSENSIDSVYVFDIWNCVRFLNYEKYNSRHYTFHLQEYPSYKDAYEVALDMMEEKPLCYPKENNNVNSKISDIGIKFNDIKNDPTILKN